MTTVNRKVSAETRRKLAVAREAANEFSNKFFGNMYVRALEDMLLRGDTALWEFIEALERFPVSIEEFLDSPEFLGSTDLQLWPRVRQAVVELNQDWWDEKKAYKEAILAGATRCVDSETEFLTPNGWKKISEYKKGDRVAQYHVSGKIKFVKPRRYVKQENKEFYHFEASNVDQMVTQDHRVIYKPENWSGIEESTAGEIYDMSRRGEWRASFISFFLEGKNLGEEYYIPFYGNTSSISKVTTGDGFCYCFTLPTGTWISRRNGKVAVTGNSGKSTILQVTGLYRLHILACMKSPQAYYSLPSATIISFSIFGAKPTVTKKVVYKPWRKWVETMPFFQKYMPVDAVMESEAIFRKKNIYVTPVGAEAEASLGAAVIVACFPASQKFLRSDGVLVSMKECVGKPVRVKTRDEYGDVIESQETTVILTGVKVLVRLYFDNGDSIVCTPEQRFKDLTNSWVSAKNAQFVLFLFNTIIDGDIVRTAHVQCTKVEYIDSPEEQVYDVENTGPTHVFFAATRSGFLEAKNCIDEINFMQVIAKSKRAEVAAGRVGAFDQAKVLYETVVRRIKGTFIKRGPQIPISIESSSTRYKGDFTDIRMEQVKNNNEKGVFIYAPTQFEARPAKYYCGEKFRLLVGNEVFNDTRILRDDEQVPEGAQVVLVPIEYKEEFVRDPHNAMRDVLGISNSSVSPFIRQRSKFYECLARGQENGLTSFLVKDHVILGIDGLPIVKPGHYCRNPSRPRYAHIDLSLTGDRAGISMVRYDGMTTVERAGGLLERLPLASVELACSIEPDSANEIDLAELRMWVKVLKDVYGYPIKAVSYDGFESTESIQQWRKQGTKAGKQSVDRSSTPYKQFRDAVYDGRVLFYENDLLFEEFFNLEYDEKKDKVDHPASSSKDIADSVVGAYTTLLERRSSWVEALRDDEAVYSERAEFGERYDGERMA